MERWRWTITRAGRSAFSDTDRGAIRNVRPDHPYSPASSTSRGFSMALRCAAKWKRQLGAAASEERVDPMSYVIDLKLRARVPTPNRTVDELGKVSPDLGNLLPGLTTMAKAEAVSPFFAQLYETKVRELRENLNRLGPAALASQFLRLPDGAGVEALRKANAARCSFRRTWMWMQTAPMVIGCRLATACRRRSNRSPVFAGERNRIGPIPTCQESKSDCTGV